MPDLIVPSRARDIGGLTVGRVLPFVHCRMVGPFVFFDHIGPREIPAGAPRSLDVRPHPHIGLATITYLFDGEITHRDSLGIHQPIRPGEVNWMTAGRGISHSERFELLRERGGLLHGIQAWVALPEDAQECAPSFEHFDRGQLSLREQDGAELRIIAGTAYGATSPVTTASRLFYVHAQLDQDAVLALPEDFPERAIYVALGSVAVDGQEVSAKNLCVIKRDGRASIRASVPSSVMLLGGDSLGARHIWWNFVSSSRERIEQAKRDWQNGVIALPVDDSDEFIPLPADPVPAPAPMS